MTKSDSSFFFIGFVILVSHTVMGQTALTVCNLVISKDRAEVVIRGEVAGSPRHGFLVSEGIDGRPCPGQRQGLFSSPSLIPLAWRSTDEVTVSEDQIANNETVRMTLAKLISDFPSARFQVLIEGVMVRKRWVFTLRRSDGEYFGNGFGPTGGYPAYIVVKSMRVLGDDEGK